MPLPNKPKPAQSGPNFAMGKRGATTLAGTSTRPRPGLPSGNGSGGVSRAAPAPGGMTRGNTGIVPPRTGGSGQRTAVSMPTPSRPSAPVTRAAPSAPSTPSGAPDRPMMSEGGRVKKAAKKGIAFGKKK